MGWSCRVLPEATISRTIYSGWTPLLSLTAPSNCLHTAVATPRYTVSADGLNSVSVGNTICVAERGRLTPLKCVKSGSGLGNWSISTSGRCISQQRLVTGVEGRAEALQQFLASLSLPCEEVIITKG